MRNINGKSSLPVYRLNKIHQDKLTLFINVVYWFIFRIILDPSVYSNVILYFIFSMHAYLSTDYQFSMVNLLFTICLAKVFLEQMNITITGGLFILFVCIKFIIFKLDEIISEIKINTISPNKVKLYKLTILYNELTMVVHLIQGPINIVIGTIYIMSPSIMTFAIEIIKWQDYSIGEFISQIALIFVILFGAIYVSILNSTCAIITDMNKSIAKTLYAIFIDTNSNRVLFHRHIDPGYRVTSIIDIWIKIKIDSFIARIDEQYFGFYCFNMFEFTRMEFYQYNIGLVTSYILIYDLYFINYRN